MTIWVDADAAPGAVKDILTKASLTRGVDVMLVANRWLPKPRAARVQTVVVPAGADVADDYIVEHCEAGDLVITADIPLADRVIERGCEVITAYGRALDADNVREALSLRDFKEELRDLGVMTGGPPPYGQSQKQAFANALDRWITRSQRG
ncbi:YaiI/YqxD family protein [Bradymonadaceae bacterium TMQ3]|nr:YaiI/YqxD family protein [Bradymonadaceae bacterium TMQ3]TXC69365.1 YaiI/YqxD family protein [Bradymonadales bacterium TMQ1]